MPNLEEMLSDAQGDKAIARLGREYGLTPTQTQAAVSALLPAISTGLKRATATPQGLADLLAVTAQQPDLRALYDNPNAAFGSQGQAAGNDLLSVIFGSRDVSRAVAERAEMQSGIGSTILKSLLPVLVGMIISRLFGQKTGGGASSAPSTAPSNSGGGIWDILQEVFRRGLSGDAQAGPAQTSPQQSPSPRGQPLPVPTDPPASSPDAGGQLAPGNDLLAAILRELQKAIQEGRLKPVVVEVPTPDGQGAPTRSAPQADSDGTFDPRPPPASRPSDEILPGPKMPSGPAAPGRDVLGDLLRDLFGGARTPQAGLGSAVFGDQLEPGRNVDPRHLDDVEKLFDRLLGDRA